MYASATQLLERYSADEIAQRADPSVPRLVFGELLSHAVAGDDLSDFSPEEQEAAWAALANIERALGDAEDTINGYIGTRYQLPLSQVPNILKLHACQIARVLLYDEDATKQVSELYQSTVKYLHDVSSGRASLGLTEAGATAAPAASAEMVSSETVFGRGRSRGFI
jgi:phage gp36-like protein